MRFRTLASGIATAVLAVGLLSAPAAATAEVEPPPTPGSEPYPTEPYVNEYGFTFDPSNPFVDFNSTGLSSAPASGAAARGAIQANPYGCLGLTENVHKSNGMVSLHARTHSCSAAPAEIVVSPEIVKLGLFGVWHSLGSTPTSSAGQGKKSLDGNKKIVCADYGFQTYRGNAYHRVLISGTNYVAQTSSLNESRLGCNAN